MNIIIFGFHLFPQFHRAGLSRRVISKNFRPFSLPLARFPSRAHSLENHENDVDDEGRVTLLVIRSAHHFPIRFLSLRTLYSFYFNYFSAGATSLGKYCRTVFTLRSDLSKQHPGPDFRGAPSLVLLTLFHYRWAGRGLGQVDTPNPRTVRIKRFI